MMMIMMMMMMMMMMMLMMMMMMMMMMIMIVYIVHSLSSLFAKKYNEVMYIQRSGYQDVSRDTCNPSCVFHRVARPPWGSR